MAWVDAKVEVQGTSLVVMDAETGNCLCIGEGGLASNEPYEYDEERLERIFGPEVFDR